MFASIFNGVGSALLLVQVGNYVNWCASESNKGLYNSLFWCFLMSSSIVGNLMAAYIITNVKDSMFYIIMSGICFLACVVFLFVPKPVKIIEK